MKSINQTTDNISSKILASVLRELGFAGIKDFQAKQNLTVDGDFGEKSFNSLYSLWLNHKDIQFTDFYAEKFDKTQIVWHHSAGWDNAEQMFRIWQNDGKGAIATPIGIIDDGTIVRGYNEDFWAHHLGVETDNIRKMGIPNTTNKMLNQSAVAVEVCNGGYLKPDKLTGKLQTYYNYSPAADRVCELKTPFRGYKYFESYTAAEIESLKRWTLLMAIKFNISLEYREKDMWELSKNALSGVGGLYTHNSYRADKADVFPQPELVEMAKNLSKYQQ